MVKLKIVSPRNMTELEQEASNIIAAYFTLLEADDAMTLHMADKFIAEAGAFLNKHFQLTDDDNLYVWKRKVQNKMDKKLDNREMITVAKEDYMTALGILSEAFIDAHQTDANVLNIFEPISNAIVILKGAANVHISYK